MKNRRIILILTSLILGGSLVSAPLIPALEKNAVHAEEVNQNFDRTKLAIGQKVSVQGTVVSDVNVWGGMGFYVETSNGQGIFVYPKKDLAIKKGNVISFIGTVNLYNGQYQLTDIKNYKLISTTGRVEAKTKTIQGLNTLNQGTYVNIENLEVKNIKSVGKYKSTIFTAVDSTGKSINVFIDNRSGADYNRVSSRISNGAKVSIKAILSVNDKGILELKPYSLDDIKILSGNGKVNEEKIVENIGVIQGESHDSPLQGQKVKVKNVVVTKVTTKGFYIQDITPDNNPKTSDAVYVVSKEKVNVGDRLTVAGVVEEGYGDGYADKNKTDLSTTQIIGEKIEKNGTAELPEAIDISKKMPKNIIDNDQFSKFDPEEDAIDYWESLEGMLVKVEQPRVLGPQLYGEIYVLPKNYNDRPLNNAGGLNLNPNYRTTEIIPILVGNRKYRAKAKDYFTEDIKGVVTYTYGAYKVEALSMPKIHNGNLEREVSKLLPSKDKLTIASYNIENFSANTSSKETPEEKVEKIAKSFINEIHNPDIISLIEVQDNNGGVDDGTVDGTKSGQRLINKIKELGGPEYKYTEVAPENNVDGGKPGANIRVAFLYNPKRVELVEKQIGGSREAAIFENGHLLKNPSRIEPTNPAFDSVRKSLAAEFKFKNENIVVIANHLKSKRGDDSLYGRKQPAIENSQASRIEQANIINNFVKNGLKQNPNLKFVLTGDFNDFEFSKTIKAVEGNELISLLTNHDEADRYSYFYRGNNQSLDNILVSKNILSKSKFDAVHVNSSFMKEDGRASDHDPLVVQIDFSNSDTGIRKDNNNSQKDNNDYGKKQNDNSQQSNKKHQDNGKVSTQNKENSKDKKTNERKLAKTGIATSGYGIIILLGAVYVGYIIRRRYKN
ncbi:endonuclease/exonuclease/phosphatase family protein [Gemella cuniculi]|uniref:endonuclease/exonuclease/phosphatase family protein n=1 Tax=Gemella cuniculi TaxID=150240 RepID=UPI00042295B3|nr:endonuclease/exonuclease/phosphatase family protein [Gemella cuniculi]